MTHIIEYPPTDIDTLIRAQIHIAGSIPESARTEHLRWPHFVASCIEFGPQDHEPREPHAALNAHALALYAQRGMEPALLVEGLTCLPSIMHDLAARGRTCWSLVMHGTVALSARGPCPAVIWINGKGRLCLDFQQAWPGFPDVPAFGIGVKPALA